MKKASIKFQLIYCINKHLTNKEYLYLVNIVSYNGNKYQSFDNWTAYAKDAKSAKSDIINRLNKSQSVDNILDDIIIKDENNMPYFVISNN